MQTEHGATLAAAVPALDSRARGCAVAHAWLRLVAGDDTTNEPGRASPDPVPEDPGAGAHVFAPFRVGKTDVGDGIACLRNQLVARTMAQTVAQPMMKARAADGQEPAPQLGHGGLRAEAILPLAPRTARRQ